DVPGEPDLLVVAPVVLVAGTEAARAGAAGAERDGLAETTAVRVGVARGRLGSTDREAVPLVTARQVDAGVKARRNDGLREHPRPPLPLEVGAAERRRSGRRIPSLEVLAARTDRSVGDGRRPDARGAIGGRREGLIRAV